MPIYEYVCQQCGENVEKLQKLSDDPLTDCPACGTSALKRKVSAAGFRLSGGGWYETDFKSDGRRNLTGGGEESSKSKSSDSSSDSSKSRTSGSESAKNQPSGDSKATSTDSKPAKSTTGKASDS